ncbi:unnamed protein product [Phytomonas sp. Hart1]|nr:unnamed protein product [Phytomonas sp. Hart1]|eukprot:CCW67677.1 unnamed protein product [Phytomonas sp. isolate Hart1]
MPPYISEEIIHAFVNRTQQALQELLRAQNAFTTEPNAPTHGAFVLAVAEVRRLLRFSETLRLRPGQPQPPTAAPTSQSGLKPHIAIPSAWLLQLDHHCQALRRGLSRSLGLLEGATPPLDDAAEARHALFHTRAMLLSELDKVEATVRQLTTTAETLSLVQHSLREVHAGMAHAQQLLRRLLRVQSRDDLLFKLSVVVFGAVVLYILLHRVFRLFPVITYVTVELS